MSVAETRIFPIERLHEFSARVFIHFGVPRDDAHIAADVLTCADLRGIDSHGVARLHAYFEMLELGRINPKANVRVIRELPGTATVDGDNGSAWWSAPRRIGSRWRKPWRSVRAGSVFATRTISAWRVTTHCRREARPDRLGDDQFHQNRCAALGRRTDARHQSDCRRLSRVGGAADCD